MNPSPAARAVDPSAPAPRTRPDRPPALPAGELRARVACGHALLWSGEPAVALEALAPAHRERPWDRQIQHLMLDALTLLGRAPEDYPWTLEPVVLRLEPELLDDLETLLARGAEPATVLDLRLAVAERGYPAFSPAALLEALERDRRFRVVRSGRAPESAVVVREERPDS